MNNVYICFGRWNDLKSKVIRWITKSEWSHVWLEYNSDEWGHRMVVHADAKGVIVEPVENFWERRKEATHVLSYKVNIGDIKTGFKDSARYLGKDYGYFALIWNALMLILLKLGFKEKWLSIAKDLNRYVCSEFAILFLKNARAEGASTLDAEAIWPGKLASWLNRSYLPGNEPGYVKVIYER